MTTPTALQRRAARVCAIVLSAALAACTGLTNRLTHEANGDAARAGSLLGRSQAGHNLEGESDDVIVKHALWLSGTPLKLPASDKLPPMFAQAASFDGNVDSLQAFAERISRLTHIPARVLPGASDAAAAHTGGAAMATGAAGVPPLPTGLLQGPSPQSAVARVAASTAQAEGASVRIVYPRGTLHGLLDIAAARFGVSWKYESGAIEFFYTETRVYQVMAIPGDSKLDTRVVSGASNSGGSSGGSMSGGGSEGSSASGSVGSGSTPTVSSDNSTNTGMSAQLSVYTGLQAAIKAMLSPAGSVLASPATGSIAVTDTPDIQQRVGEFMAQQNRVLGRQVLVNVSVLSVTLSADDSYGIDWSAVYQALGTQFGISNAFKSVVTGMSPATFSAQVITPSSRASATSAMISALSQQGTVRRKTSASVTTLNDQPVPVQVATQQGYLAQISTTSTLNVGTQTSLVPGTITTGFNLTLLPHILDDGTVMMQFYTNISSLQDLSSFGPTNQQIQLPTVDTRNFLQRIAMKSGQTLVISGYEGVAEQTRHQGVGRPDNYVFGGGESATQAREIIVILITPISVNGA
ncbi:PilN family type IVB pilus formation outer membrane protein [Paraburkholderia sp. Ac-20340]|uniref:PilN family type IVB pilus formation outer membrane protein n=1 Tax=Paraburkholderia sp. Ac-20340 TaxID=2703888 RepID=UPI00197D5130|nr:PilN family type IVB pilus formation outer membrane protein [Paraburkholderia sp. Ac-20340]MBN3853204.1 PilN family type IVB pilus formation outer membrane protein [Paraburkholderia sp. Ac-20340]